MHYTSITMVYKRFFYQLSLQRLHCVYIVEKLFIYKIHHLNEGPSMLVWTCDHIHCTINHCIYWHRITYLEFSAKLTTSCISLKYYLIHMQCWLPHH